MAEFRDAYRLICAFTAVEGAEIFADDGFAGEGDVIRGGDQVEIDAAHYYDWFAHLGTRLQVWNVRKSRSLSASRARQTTAGRKKRGTSFGMTRRSLFREVCGCLGYHQPARARQLRRGIFCATYRCD